MRYHGPDGTYKAANSWTSTERPDDAAMTFVGPLATEKQKRRAAVVLAILKEPISSPRVPGNGSQ